MPSDSSIHFACSQCERKLQAPIHAAGKVGSCKHCGTKNKIPVPMARSSPTAQPVRRPTTAPVAARTSQSSPEQVHDALRTAALPDFQSTLDEAIQEANVQVNQVQGNKLTPEDVTRAIRESLPKRSVSSAYRLQLFLVAITMSVLPLLYLAFVVAVAAGVVYYCMVIAPQWLTSIRVNRVTLFIYAAIVAPAVMGGIMVLFMIKPLFFRTREERRRRSLNRQAQ